MPASQDALIAGSMASRLRVTDIRYDTSCFGSFLRYIPERIGCNKALDTAADAFAATFTNLHHARDASTQCFVKHGRALKALRDTMGSPTQATDPETICAIYLTMLTEVRTNRAASLILARKSSDLLAGSSTGRARKACRGDGLHPADGDIPQVEIPV